MNKSQIIQALRSFINQRSGIDFRNYQSGDLKSSRESFMGDYRPILKRGKQAREMLRAIEWRDSITAENILSATRAFSGRLQIVDRGGKVSVDYCAGQYFPTEYRAAACAVLAQVLWDYWRETGDNTIGASPDYIRKQAAREFGRGIARDWFN